MPVLLEIVGQSARHPQIGLLFVPQRGVSQEPYIYNPLPCDTSFEDHQNTKRNDIIDLP